MRYRNIKTGQEIETYGTVSGDGWEEVNGKPSPSSKPKQKGDKKS